MGLGLFGASVHPNVKCLVFSCILLFVYFALPMPRANAHKFVAGFLLASAAYVGLAWYDYLYDCNDRLRPSPFGWLTGWAKPPDYKANYAALPDKEKRIIRNIDVAVLGVIVAAIAYPYWVIGDGK